MSGRTRPRILDRERVLLELRRAGGPAVALLALIAVAIASALIIFANIGVTLPWQSTYERQIALDDVKGVVPQKQTVRIAGVTVGRIESVKLAGGRPVMTISIDPKYAPLYRNAHVRLRPETPLDDMYLDIESRGTPDAGMLGASDVLPADRTATPVDISSVLDVFNADTRTRVKQSIDALGAGLGPHGAQFRAALAELGPFLAAARQLTTETALHQAQTARVIHNFGVLTGELARRERQVKLLVSSGAGALGVLGQDEAAVQGVIGQLPQTMAQLETTFTTLRATADHLDPAFESLHSVAAALPAGLQGLRSFSLAAEPAFARLRRPLPQLNALMGALAPASAGLRASFDALAPVPGRLDRITSLVTPCEAALAKFFENTISLGKFQDRDSVILRGQVVAGLNSLAGVANDPTQTAARSCAPGGPGG